MRHTSLTLIREADNTGGERDRLEKQDKMWALGAGVVAEAKTERNKKGGKERAVL